MVYLVIYVVYHQIDHQHPPPSARERVLTMAAIFFPVIYLFPHHQKKYIYKKIVMIVGPKDQKKKNTSREKRTDCRNTSTYTFEILCS
jgi:hypothetical protein